MTISGVLSFFSGSQNWNRPTADVGCFNGRKNFARRLQSPYKASPKQQTRIWTQIYNRAYIKFVYTGIQPYAQAYIITAHIVVCTRHTQVGRIKRTPLSSGCEQERWLPYKGTRDGGRAGGENWKNNWLLLLAHHHSDVLSFSCLGPGLVLVLFLLRLYIYRCTITLFAIDYEATYTRVDRAGSEIL